MRRATNCGAKMDEKVEISIHALREEGDPIDFYVLVACEISIHALREEGDPVRVPDLPQQRDFNPRPP